MITKVYEFNRMVLGVDPQQLVLPLDLPEQTFLIAALEEELQEFKDSTTQAEEVDALLDLCYFAIGGLARLGLSETQSKACFDAIHTANMTKKKGVKDTRPNDGSVADAIKDPNFQDPTKLIEEILLNG